MAITIKVVERSSHGRFHEVLAKLTFGANDYAAGGYAINPSQLGLGNIQALMSMGNVGIGSSGVRFMWDDTTIPLNYGSSGKLMVLRSIASAPPAIIPEESVTITNNVGTLANPPAYIMAVNASAGGTTGACSVVPVGSTVATTQCAVNWATGGLTFFGTDAVTTALVTYIPMGVGPFVPANQVVDESVALPNGSTVNLANQAALVQYIYESTTLLAPLAIIGTQNSPAAGQIQIQLNNSGATTVTDNAAQNGKTGKATYWKMSGFGVASSNAAQYGWTDRTSTNATSNVINFASALAAGDVNGTFINLYGVHRAALATNTDKPSLALTPSGTPAASSPVINPATNRITFVVGDSITREFVGGLLLNELLLNYSTEVSPGFNLSGVTTYVRAFGTK